jgi:glycosyltransferase involved in cell wall biosynthesis
MKVLMIMGQTERKLTHYVTPLTKIQEISEIHIVRDQEGPVLDKVTYHYPPGYLLSLPLLRNIVKILLMLSLAIRQKPDFIHGIRVFPYGLIAFLVAKITWKKVGVTFIAGPIEACTLYGSGTGKFIYGAMKSSNNCSKLMMKVLNRFDYILVSGTFTENFLKVSGINQEKISILQRVSPVDYYPDFPNSTEKKKIDLVYVGRLEPVKNLKTLIHAIPIILETLPDFSCVIIGDGVSKNELIELTKKLNLEDVVHFKGYQKDIWKWYNQSQLSIITSEREGFPYSAVESLSCGVPVMTSDCGDICDIIHDNINGNVIRNCYDAEGFARAIVRVLSDPKLLEDYSKNARYTSNQLTVNKVIDVWSRIIHTH